MTDNLYSVNSYQSGPYSHSTITKAIIDYSDRIVIGERHITFNFMNERMVFSNASDLFNYITETNKMPNESYNSDYAMELLIKRVNEERAGKVNLTNIADKIVAVAAGRDEDQIVEEIIEAEKYHPVDTGSRAYYKDIVPGYEYFQLMEHLLGHEGFIGHARGQIFKYSMRFGKKDDLLLEITKVAWYSAYLKDYLERFAKGETPYKAK